MALTLVARRNLKSAFNTLRLGLRRYCSNLEDRDKPVKFTTSEAAQWRAEFSRTSPNYEDMPDAQIYIVTLSTAIFMAYFFILREESDIDELFDLTRSIYDRVEDLEEVQLKLYRKSLLERNEDTTEVDERLEVVISERLAREAANKTSVS